MRGLIRFNYPKRLNAKTTLSRVTSVFQRAPRASLFLSPSSPPPPPAFHSRRESNPFNFFRRSPPPPPLFFFLNSFIRYRSMAGGTSVACARSALEWPNSFCPENVFRVTAPRKSKFGRLNWVLFHALRSRSTARCSRDFCRPSLQPSVLARQPSSLSLSLSLAAGT